jgi:subtilisin family serine protease
MKSQLNVQVFDYTGKRLSGAVVELLDFRKKTTALSYNRVMGNYLSGKLKSGVYQLRAAVTGLSSQIRDVRIDSGDNEEIFMLGKKGMPYYYRGQTKVPFQPLPQYIGVILKNADEAEKRERELEEIVKSFQLQRVTADKNIIANGLLIYQWLDNFPEDEKRRAQESIMKLEFVYLCSPILKLFEKNATLLTDTIIVKFKGDVNNDEVKKIEEKYHLYRLRHIPYAGNAFEFRVPGIPSLSQLEICELLVAKGSVEYAEPNLWHTVEEDAIVPTNWLFPEQWDHTIINTTQAWQVLHDINPVTEFGDPNVIVGIVDSGINSAHQQFIGTVSNGQPKIYQLFDFINMVPNNNSLSGSHGTCCASAAIGMTTTSSVVAGVPDGTAGIAGNCRVIGVRRGGPESTYSDVYIWTGGFNPNSALPGFPAQITPGADIISSSFGMSIGAPISGLMKDTFDFLTTYGRNGKGVLLFFSAGNQGGGGCTGADSTLLRPWSVYTKCHSITASTLSPAGAEVKASYSNFNPFAKFCAPSNSNCTGIHNPPNDYGAFTATILGDGNVPRNREVQTTLSANANAGTNQITVSNTAGIIAGQALLLRNPGTAGAEGHTISAVNAATNVITLDNTFPILSNHANGTVVNAGNADYINNFGGTSYATPVCAGLAALMLSVNPNLTWMEVREIIKETAVKIDPNNADPVGRWRDVNGLISTDMGYAGPFFSQWYGFGRIDAAAAVQAAVDYEFSRDIFVRDNMADAGATTSAGNFWNGVDIWVRNANDGVSPASYATDANTVHQDPIFGQTNFLNVRFRNIGTATSYNFFMRTYITHWPGTEFIYPQSFQPSNNPGDPIPSPLTTGTYLIGEAAVASLAADADSFVTIPWTANLIPPKEVLVSGMNVKWHPCILVEVTPQDGFTPTGNHVWENNNLAQKNLSIVYNDSNASGDNAFAGVIGNPDRLSKFHKIRFVIKWPVPRDTQIYVRFLNDYIERYLIAQIKEKKIKDIKLSWYDDQPIFLMNHKRLIKLKLPNVGLLPFVVVTKIKKWKAKDSLVIEVYQYDDNNRLTGGLTFQVLTKTAKPKVKKVPAKILHKQLH